MKVIFLAIFVIYSSLFAFSSNQELTAGLVLLIFIVYLFFYFKKRISINLKNYTLAFLVTIMAGLTILTHTKHFLFQPFQVRNKSMYPFLKPGDQVIIEKISMGLITNFYETNHPVYRFHLPIERSLRKGDVVILVNPANKDIIIKRIQSIKDGNYCVYGDNPEHSFDSRDFGCVPSEAIIGRMIYHFKIST